MKKSIYTFIFAALAVLSLASCTKYNLDGADLTYLTISYGTEGNYLPSFSSTGGAYTTTVVINQGGVNRDVDWTVSVDNEPDWITVDPVDEIECEFTGTYDGDDRTYTLRGILIVVDENLTEAKRTAVIRFTVADGSSISTTITQNK